MRFCQKIRYGAHHLQMIYNRCIRPQIFTILALDYEPFGLVGPESVLSGTPCVFSNVIGATEVLDDYVCYKFDLKDKNSLLGLLEKIDSLKIRIEKPKEHINYSVSRSDHLQAIFRECGIGFLPD